MTAKYRVIIADDHAIFREGIRSVFSRDPRFLVVGEAGNGREAVEQTAALKPDLVILDIAMPEFSGIEAARRIMSQWPFTRIIMVSIHSRKPFILEALKVGARGYLLKESAADKLLVAAEAVMRGDSYLDSPVANHIINEFVKESSGLAPAPPDSALTERERQVLLLVVEGLSSREIAEKLFISIKTVEHHRANLMAKLQVHDLIDLVKFAITAGLIDVDSWCLRRAEAPQTPNP
ncbi:MAG: response regulator transcription factor [Pseudomonadota bacterium]